MYKANISWSTKLQLCVPFWMFCTLAGCVVITGLAVHVCMCVWWWGRSLRQLSERLKAVAWLLPMSFEAANSIHKH